MRRGLAVATVLLVALSAGAPARAADIGPDDEVVVTGTVNIPKGTHADRVWIVDGVVNVAGHSEGSIVAIRAPVRISGIVDGDVIALAKRDHAHAERADQRRHRLREQAPGDPKGATVYGDVRHIDAADVSLPFGTFAAIHVAIWLAVTALHARARAAAPVGCAARRRTPCSAAARTAAGPAIGWGAALFFGLPLAALIALVTLVGIPLGILMLLALLPLWALGYVTLGLAARKRGREEPGAPPGREVPGGLGNPARDRVRAVPRSPRGLRRDRVRPRGARGRAVARAGRAAPAARYGLMEGRSQSVGGTVEFLWESAEEMLVHIEPDRPGAPHVFEIKGALRERLSD